MVIPLGLMVPDPDLEERGGMTGRQPVSAAQVCLVGATRVPGRRGVRVTGCVCGVGAGETLVFDQDPEWMLGKRVQLEPSLVVADARGFVELMVHNSGDLTRTRKLSSGDLIGRVEEGCQIEEANSEEDGASCQEHWSGRSRKGGQAG